MRMDLTLTSIAFAEGEHIPAKYTCDGENISPPLSIADAPPDTASFALIMEDPDVPEEVRPGGIFDHWVMFNIPADTTEVAEDMLPGTPGANSSGKSGYTGPCPPSDMEPKEHRYFLRLYALDIELALTEGASKDDVLDAMKGHVLATAELMGRYARA